MFSQSKGLNAIAFFDPKSSHFSIPVSGTIKLHQDAPYHPTKISIFLKGFPPNKVMAIHIHTYGDLSNGCHTAAGHYNPYNKLHGSENLHGNDRHVGDLINNIKSDDKGVVSMQFSDDLVYLYGMYTVIGRMIVIHENVDDLGLYRYEKSKRGELSRTTGNAGGRVACSVIGLAA